MGSVSHVDSVYLMPPVGSVCLSHVSCEQCVSDLGSVSDVGSVCLTWAVCVSHGQPTVWAIQVGDTGGYAVGSDQSSRKMVAMSGHQMEGCTGLSIGIYSQLS